jgi:hypothetical protein
VSRARTNRRRRPFDGDLCHCGRRWQDVPPGSTRTLAGFRLTPSGGVEDTEAEPNCWHPDEHPGQASRVTPEEFIAGTTDRTGKTNG